MSWRRPKKTIESKVLRWVPPALAPEDLKYGTEVEQPIPVFWNLDRYLANHLADRFQEFKDYASDSEAMDEDLDFIITSLREYAASSYILQPEAVITNARKAFRKIGKILPNLWD